MSSEQETADNLNQRTRALMSTLVTGYRQELFTVSGTTGNPLLLCPANPRRVALHVGCVPATGTQFQLFVKGDDNQLAAFPRSSNQGDYGYVLNQTTTPFIVMCELWVVLQFGQTVYCRAWVKT